MSDGFTLGGILFGPWETPSKISLPSGQKINKHVMIGGQRQIDAMGPDPAPLSWTGRARGQNAASDMQSVKAMCDAGAQVTLEWNEYTYTVVIEKFDPQYKTPIEWEYSITVEIVDDPSAGMGAASLSSLDSLVGGDLTTVMGLVQ